MAQSPAPRYGAYFGLSVGLSMALAANLTATWPQGPVMIGTGLTAPLVLPLALWIRASFIPSHWLARIVRELSIVAVAAPAAALSYWHTYELMISHGVPFVIAASLPLSADGVATVSTLALHHQSRFQRKRPKSTNLEPKTAPVSTPPSPARRTVADEIQSRRTDRAGRVAWLQAQELGTWTEQVTAVERHFNVSRSTAKRIVSEAAS